MKYRLSKQKPSRSSVERERSSSAYDLQQQQKLKLNQFAFRDHQKLSGREWKETVFPGLQIHGESELQQHPPHGNDLQQEIYGCGHPKNVHNW